MISRIARTIAVLLVLSATLTGRFGFADDGNKPEKPTRLQKVKGPRLEDVSGRAISWARKSCSDHKGFARMTTIMTDATDETTIVLTVEFGDGAIALYQGAMDAAEDHWVMLNKSDLDLLSETISRANHR